MHSLSQSITQYTHRITESLDGNTSLFSSASEHSLNRATVPVMGYTDPTLARKGLMTLCGLNQPHPTTPALGVRLGGMSFVFF